MYLITKNKIIEKKNKSKQTNRDMDESKEKKKLFEVKQKLVLYLICLWHAICVFARDFQKKKNETAIQLRLVDFYLKSRL